MADIYIDVEKSKTMLINLGVQEDNLVQNVVFKITKWIEDYGEGVAYIYARRHNDENEYPIALEMDLENETATWVITQTDTAQKGKGYARLVYVVDEDDDNDYLEDPRKQRTFRTTVQPNFGTYSLEQPDGYETWLEVLGGYTARIEQALIDALTAQTASELAQSLAEIAQAASEAALAEIAALIHLVDLFKKKYNLSDKSVVHWVGLAVDTREKLRSWRNADKRKYLKQWVND